MAYFLLLAPPERLIMQIPTTLASGESRWRTRDDRVTATVLKLTTALTAGLYALLWLSA